MVTQEPLLAGAVLAGGHDGTGLRPADPIVSGSVAAAAREGAAADLWPAWARGQLQRAVALAAAAPTGTAVAPMLHRDWFTAPVAGRGTPRAQRPLAGLYRAAHAGSAAPPTRDGLPVLDRHDVIGADGWWRTWGESWTPPRSRPGSVRLLLTPTAAGLAPAVRAVTEALDPTRVPWSLACATDPRRTRRLASMVLDLTRPSALPPGLLTDLVARLGPALAPAVPPLCLPLAPGVALAAYPRNGMAFGEHRCHLVALALRHPVAADPLASIAAVFRAHGLDPAAPYCDASEMSAAWGTDGLVTTLDTAR